MDARSTLEQLLAPYTNPESHNAQHHRQTDGQTDGRTDGQQAYANSRSYCVAVRSAKNKQHQLASVNAYITWLKFQLIFRKCAKFHENSTSSSLLILCSSFEIAYSLLNAVRSVRTTMEQLVQSSPTIHLDSLAVWSARRLTSVSAAATSTLQKRDQSTSEDSSSLPPRFDR